MGEIGSWVGVFIAFIALDFTWARYFRAVAEKRKHHAGLWSAAITLLAGVATIMYVDNNWLLLSALAGGYIGTVWGVAE